MFFFAKLYILLYYLKLIILILEMSFTKKILVFSKNLSVFPALQDISKFCLKNLTLPPCTICKTPPTINTVI